MADDYDDVDDTYDDQERTNAEWAALRKEKKARQQAEAKAAEAQRTLAFYQAGIPTDDPKMTYFVKGYEGEATPDAIRQAAIEAGFLDAQQPNQQVAAQVQGQQRIAMAATAGVAESAGGQAMLAALDEAYQQGGAGAVLAAMAQAGIPLSSQG